MSRALARFVSAPDEVPHCLGRVQLQALAHSLKNGSLVCVEPEHEVFLASARLLAYFHPDGLTDGSTAVKLRGMEVRMELRR